MLKLLTAIALTIALPAVAQAAEPASTPEAMQACCEKMKAEGKECCCHDMDHKGHAGHGGHDSASGQHEVHQR